MRFLPLYFTVTLLLLTCTVFGQDNMEKWKLARIKDKDGFTYVHNFPGKKYEIIDTVKTGEFMLCNPVDSGYGYYPVKPVFMGDRRDSWGRELDAGYMHKSRIEFIDSLPDSTQHNVYFGIMEDYRKAIVHFRSQKNYTQKEDEYVVHFQAIYWSSVYSFYTYFNEKKDTTLLFEFFKASYLNDGAVAEFTSGYLAKCFVENETLFLNQLKKEKKEVRAAIVKNTDFGLNGVFYPAPIPNAKKLEHYQDLLKKLN